MDSSNKFNESNFRSFFRSEVYRELQPEDRMALIKLTVEQVRKEQGLAPVEVAFVKQDPQHRGATWSDYSEDGEKVLQHHISINDDVIYDPSIFTSYSVYQTIHHELRHDYQHEVAVDRSIDNSDPYVLEQRLNQQHYYRYGGDKTTVSIFGKRSLTYRFGEETDKQLYYAEAVEKDARVAGAQAIEKLRSDYLTDDPTLDAFIYQNKQLEASKSQHIMEALGVHSREELAREELRYIPEDKLSNADRERVLSYAREKDLEAYTEYIENTPWLKLSKEQIETEFNEDFKYDNFFKSECYQKNKAMGKEREYSDLSHYKWDESGENFLERNRITPQVGNSAEDEDFLKTHERKESALPTESDDKFFENAHSSDKQSNSDNGQNVPTKANTQTF